VVRTSVPEVVTTTCRLRDYVPPVDRRDLKHSLSRAP
jgi:hypothetical protein